MTAWDEKVLQFWFGGSDTVSLGRSRPLWFKKDAAFDALIREQFGSLLEAVTAGALEPATNDARQMLAWLIVADQFSRNLFRGEAQAFACDGAARELSRAMIAAGLDQSLPAVARWFVYLPLEHSENMADQDEAVRCFESLPPDSPGRDGVIDYAHRHRAVIARFGRFPHRNAALGRLSTEEELSFLAQPGSSF